MVGYTDEWQRREKSGPYNNVSLDQVVRKKRTEEKDLVHRRSTNSTLISP